MFDEKAGRMGYAIGYCSCGEKLIVGFTEAQDLLEEWGMIQYSTKPHVTKFIQQKIVHALGGQILEK